MAETQNYTLGRGKLYFSRFVPGTQNVAGFRYIGNTPEFNLTIESETLDHFSSDAGIREKDDSVPLQVTRSGSMITDNIHPENIALFFFGAASTVAQIEALSQSQALTNVVPGLAYKLGQTAANPAGYFGLAEDSFNLFLTGQTLVAATGNVTFTDVGDDGDEITVGGVTYTMRAVPTLPNEVDIGANVTASAANLAAAINAGAGAGTAYGTGTVEHNDVSATPAAGVVNITAKVSGTAGNAITLNEDSTDVTKSGATLTGGTGTSYIEGVDYTVDYTSGVLTIETGGAIVDGAEVTALFGVRNSTRQRVESGSEPVEGALMFLANNPKGSDFHYYLPWVKITPNGDYAMKGDEWQQIPFSLEALKPVGGPAILMDGVPVYS